VLSKKQIMTSTLQPGSAEAQSLRVIGPQDKIPFGASLVNTTSRSPSWGFDLAPFSLGPVQLPRGWPIDQALNVGNAWQFAKVYAQHLNTKGDPSSAYWQWAVQGWKDNSAHRSPMGEGHVPSYSLWVVNGRDQHLGYIEARKQIYAPIYAEAVKKTPAFAQLTETYRQARNNGRILCLWDFDGYDHIQLGRSLSQVINDPGKKMGHAFVLYHLLTGEQFEPR
jgi:hypothetical protein